MYPAEHDVALHYRTGHTQHKIVLLLSLSMSMLMSKVAMQVNTAAVMPAQEQTDGRQVSRAMAVIH